MADRNQEAVARRSRRRLLGAELTRHQEERGEFTDEELTEARTRIFGEAEPGSSAGTAG
ncbi:hypothetical protein [Nonomuraea candida]|uniref:hypothetical protein n=1 Tax=Nonomuraea candida TaxID=359159 RepID=UPI000A7AD40A|nr:hypothetical protein [Nonomuraea candida]